MSQGTGWLPQIGTSSDCNLTGFSGATYSLTWEMYSQVNGGGNAVQYGLDCPGNKTYSLCAWKGAQPPYQQITTMPIAPGDHINAAVAFLGPYTSGSQVRTFEIRLTDLTNGEFAVGHITTNLPAQLPDIASQGGAIVEDNPPCSIDDIVNLRACARGFINGLAKFHTPIQVTGMGTLTENNGAGNNVPLLYNEWVMERSYFHGLLHRKLAQNSSPSGSAQVGHSGLSFSVTWLHTK
jgi:hypothetical protein